MEKVFYLMMALLFVFCDENNPTPPVANCTRIDDPDATQYIQVTYPRANDTLKVGQTIKIKVKVEQVNGQDIVNDLEASLYVDEKTKITVFEKSKPVESSGIVTCLELQWTIGEEYTDYEFKDKNVVKLRVNKYNDVSFSYTTKPFVIVK